MTLIEVLIATAILGAVIAITFSVLWSTQSTYNEASIAQELEARSRTFIDTYKKELAFGKISAYSLDGSSIRYQVPLSTSAAGALTYGYNYQGDQAGWDVELAFVPETMYAEGNAALSPPPSGATTVFLNGMDVNADGDTDDSFVSGKIVKRIRDVGGNLIEQVQVTERVILGWTLGSYAVDINGDSVLDMLFSVLDSNGNIVPAASLSASGVKFRLQIWHGNFSDKRDHFVLRHVSDEWVLKNDQ